MLFHFMKMEKKVDTYDYESLRVIDVSYENDICYVVVEKIDK